MKVAILTRPGGCFPNIISQGLQNMLQEIGVDSKLFYEAIPFLMRLLPLSEKPKRWSNNFHFRVRNKLRYYLQDKRLMDELKQYDMIVLSECLTNALWKNYLSVEELKKRINKPVGSYSDGSISIAPLTRKTWLDEDDYDDTRYDFNLFVSEVIELRFEKHDPRRKVIGLNLQNTGLEPVEKKKFIAVVDFPQKGYELYREQQIAVLKKLNIETIVLNGRYQVDEIRDIYRSAAIFFMASPESFGLPIAECLASGAYIFTPNSSWPMAWRLNEQPMPWGPGELPDCFQSYNSEEELASKLNTLRASYDLEKTPVQVFNEFIKHYSHLYYGDKEALRSVLEELK